MTDRIEAYSSFARVMETGNFSSAGRLLGISQSTVSKHIAGLETVLGTQLFVRTTRRINPTPEAWQIYEHIQHMLESFETAHALIKGEQPEAVGILRIAMPISLGRKIIIPLLPSFLERNPALTIDTVLSDEEKDLVGEHLELALVSKAPTEGSLITRRLCVFEWRIVATPGYLEKYGVPNDPIELERHAIVVPKFLPNQRLEFESENGRQAIDLSSRLFTNSEDVAYDAALEGTTIAVIPSWLCDTDIRQKKMISLLTDYYLPPIKVDVIYPQTRFLSRRARNFIDFMVTKLSGGSVF